VQPASSRLRGPGPASLAPGGAVAAGDERAQGPIDALVDSGVIIVNETALRRGDSSLRSE
jgi:hypothetical protein